MLTRLYCIVMLIGYSKIGGRVKGNLKKTGRLITKKRKALGLTQEELSEKFFVTPQAVSLWENGKRFPDPAALVMIVFTFQCTIGANPLYLTRYGA